MDIGGRSALVVDGSFAAPFVNSLFEQIVERTPLSFRRVNRSDQQGFPSLSALVHPSRQRLGEPWAELARQAISGIPKSERSASYALVRIQVNVTAPGDEQLTHRDQEVDITAVYFANPEWRGDWLGELLFYSDEDPEDVVGAVTPRPGRLAIFDSAALHRGGVPSLRCQVPRVTVALKFRKRSDASTSRD